MKNEKRTKVKSFIKQDLALDSYLSTLLNDLPSIEQLEVQEKIKSKPVERKAKPAVKSAESEIQRIANKHKKVIPAIRKEAKKEVKKDVELVEKKRVERKEVELPLPKLGVPETKPKLKSKSLPTQVKTIAEPIVLVEEEPVDFLPAYMKEDFLALFFRVGKSILAAPLVAIARTIKYEQDALTKIPRQPSWYLGVQSDVKGKVSIVNTLSLMDLEEELAQRNYEDEPLGNVLLTLDGEWGLACDEVMNISKINVSTVHWRVKRDKNPWRMGTVGDELAIIVDIDKFVPENHSKYIIGRS